MLKYEASAKGSFRAAYGLSRQSWGAWVVFGIFGCIAGMIPESCLPGEHLKQGLVVLRWFCITGVSLFSIAHLIAWASYGNAVNRICYCVSPYDAVAMEDVIKKSVRRDLEWWALQIKRA